MQINSSSPINSTRYMSAKLPKENLKPKYNSFGAAKFFSYPKKYYLNQINFGRLKNDALPAEISHSVDEERMKQFDELPDNVKSKCHRFVDKFEDDELDLSKFLKTALKKRHLLLYSPETMERNIRNFVAIFNDDGLSLRDYLSCALKQPTLFTQYPETIEKNVRDFVERFENDGLTVERFLKMGVKSPSLFYQSPETIEKNVKDFADRFSENGLNYSDYVQACFKHPTLFLRSPEFMEADIRELVDKFKDHGLTVDTYLQACIKQPPLFYQSPDTIEKNVKELVARFLDKGLDFDCYLSACIKNPALLYRSTDTLSEHIDILRFSKFNNGEKIDNSEFFDKITNHSIELNFSTSLILIKNLIIPKIFENSSIPKSLKVMHHRENLISYLKDNQDKKYLIKVKNIDSKTDCIKLLKETLADLSLSASGRDDMFEVVVTE